MLMGNIGSMGYEIIQGFDIEISFHSFSGLYFVKSPFKVYGSAKTESMAIYQFFNNIDSSYGFRPYLRSEIEKYIKFDKWKLESILKKYKNA